MTSVQATAHHATQAQHNRSISMHPWYDKNLSTVRRNNALIKYTAMHSVYRIIVLIIPPIKPLNNRLIINYLCKQTTQLYRYKSLITRAKFECVIFWDWWFALSLYVKPSLLNNGSTIAYIIHTYTWQQWTCVYNKQKPNEKVVNLSNALLSC